MLGSRRESRKPALVSSPPRIRSPILLRMTIDRRFPSPATLALGGLLLLTVACGKKADAPEVESGTPTMQAAPDDIVPESAAIADTMPGAPVAPSTAPSTAPSAGKAPSASTPTGGAVIGYDSAFGPSYALDSAGRAIPLKKRKP
jgi:hypothetical protein